MFFFIIHLGIQSLFVKPNENNSSYLWTLKKDPETKMKMSLEWFHDVYVSVNL